VVFHRFGVTAVGRRSGFGWHFLYYLCPLQAFPLGLFWTMKTLKLAVGIAFVGLVGVQLVAADPLAPAVLGTKNGGGEKLVFVTGSRIPQRVQVKAIGTNTVSPMRVFTREEIDRTGRFTTQGILAQDPSVNIINGTGIGSH
jgi:hypothetical protein